VRTIHIPSEGDRFLSPGGRENYQAKAEGYSMYPFIAGSTVLLGPVNDSVTLIPENCGMERESGFVLHR